MMEALDVGTRVALAGLALGGLFGVLARLSGFCLRRAVADVVERRDRRRLQAWSLALAVAILGSQSLAAAGWVDLEASAYLGPTLAWGGLLIGGILFGIGMVLAGGCGQRLLVLAAGGNLRSALTLLVFAVFAYMTMNGLTALLRTEGTEAVAIPVTALGLEGQSLPHLAARVTGGDGGSLALPLAVALAGGLAVFAFLRPSGGGRGDADQSVRRRSWGGLAAAAGIGLLVPAGWAATGILGVDDFEPTPLASLTFTGPIGESLQYLMTFTGAELDFGIALVGGVVVGSLGVAVLRGEWRLEGFSGPGQMVVYLAGGALMGIGGVMALGCTIGQGLSGLSTLSLGSILALASIGAGTRLGLLLRRFLARSVPDLDRRQPPDSAPAPEATANSKKTDPDSLEFAVTYTSGLKY